MPASLLHSVSRLVAAPDPRADAQLVAAFLNDASQDAFAELVRRHGPTVLGVCRRFLGPTPDAEDAFQATFLVLVRRARATEWRASLGPWLYGVAMKVARKARAVRAKRLTNERQVPAMNEPTREPTEPDDTGTAVDEALAALPAHYRQPLILCEIQGVSRRDAARELGLSEGTLSSRLARGRKLLRDRLAKRGIAPTAAGLAVAVPASLASATVRSAVGVLTHATGAVPAGVLFLTEGVTKTMLAKWKLAGVLVVTCLGLTGFGSWQGSAQPAPGAAANQPLAAPPAAKEKPPEKPPERRVAEDGAARVATIFGDVGITREQFVDHLIKRYGEKELKLFVHKQIVSRAFAAKGLSLTPAEVAAAIDETCAALKMTREQFARTIQKNTGRTLDEWNEDMNVPALMLARLAKQKVAAPTDAELRQAFDVKYGEKLDCRIIMWTADEADEARAAYEKVRGSEKEFDACARQRAKRFPGTGTAPDGRAPELIARARPLEDNPAEQAVHATAAGLRAGEVSRLTAIEHEGKGGFIVLKCDRVIPADRTKSFENEKAALLNDVMQAKIGNETQKLSRALVKEADPKYHLTFPEPKASPEPKK